MSAEKPLSDEDLEVVRHQMTEVWPHVTPYSAEKTAHRLLATVDRLRARERKLVERIADHIEWLHARGYYPVAEELRAAIEENDDGK